MENLHTLVLGNFDRTSFVSALNPNRNASTTVICPKLEELSLVVKSSSYIDEISEMAKVRASRSAKLLTVMVFSTEFTPTHELGLESLSRVWSTSRTKRSLDGISFQVSMSIMDTTLAGRFGTRALVAHHCSRTHIPHCFPLSM